MKCHNERVARSRRHAAKQKQRERERHGVKDYSSGAGESVPTASSSTGREHVKEASILVHHRYAVTDHDI